MFSVLELILTVVSADTVLVVSFPTTGETTRYRALVALHVRGRYHCNDSYLSVCKKTNKLHTQVYTLT